MWEVIVYWQNATWFTILKLLRLKDDYKNQWLKKRTHKNRLVRNYAEMVNSGSEWKARVELGTGVSKALTM